MEKEGRLKYILFMAACVSGLSVTHQAAAAGSVEKAGDILQILIPAVAWGGTFYKHDPDGRTQFYKSFATNLVVTHGLKAVVHKKRPNGSDKSFPSGHTSAAFQGAAFIQKRYGFKAALPAWLAATYVGYSRVQSKNHYTVDVVAGAAIGIASSWFFTSPYKGVSITPYVADGGGGISISGTWK